MRLNVCSHTKSGYMLTIVSLLFVITCQKGKADEIVKKTVMSPLYASVSLGYINEIDLDASESAAHYSNGLSLLLGIGWEFNRIRVEGELLLAESELRYLSDKGGVRDYNYNATLSINGLMFSVLYDSTLRGNWTLSSGLGLGYTDIDIGKLTYQGSDFVLNEGGDRVAALQVKVGAVYQMFRQYKLQLNYRYVKMEGFTIVSNIGGNSFNVAGPDIGALEVGLLVDF